MIPLFKPYMPAKLPDLDRIIQSGQLAYGKYAREFEARLAEYIGIDEVLCTSSFNSAYLVLIRTLGLGHGDEVVASPMCCLASSQPFAVNGIKLIWADIDPSTGTLDPEAVKSKITPRTRAIVHNHFCGYAGHVGEMRKIADEHGLMLIDDVSEAFGTEYHGRKAGFDMWKGPYGNWGSRKYLIASLDQSLKRLGLEYVDIFYHHRMDPETPLEETMGALDSIVKSGKALYVGLSNYDGPTLKKAAAILNDLKCPFIINQNRYSIFDRTIEENGLKETAHDLKKGIIAFSPLAQGMLTNRYLNGIPADSRIAKDGRFLHESSLTPERLSQIKALNELAGQRGQTLAEMALSWILKDDHVTSVLIGASKPEQILDNIGIIGHTSFSKEELDKIDAIVK